MSETEAVQEEETSRAEKAEALIKKHLYASVVAGAIPIAYFDLIAVTAVQQKLVHSLAKLYETKYSEALGRSALSSLLSFGLANGGKRVVAASAAKLIPGFGTLLGITANAGLSAAATYAIGRAFTAHFESGGTLLTFDAEKIEAYYREQFGAAQKEPDRISWAGTKP